MKKVIFSAILALLAGPIGLGTTAMAAEPAKPNSVPESDLDSWDDDVWSDWGTQPSAPGTSKGGAPNLADKDDVPPAQDDLGAAGFSGGSDRFGTSADAVRFNLVRDGFSRDEGVRKFRPDYGQSRRKRKL